MKFSELWLRSLVDPPLNTAELAHALTMAGLEVETLEPAALARVQAALEALVRAMDG